MRKKICRAASIGALSFGTFVSAQHHFNLALDAGVTSSSLHADLSNQIESRYKSRIGLGINLSGEYMIWKSLFASVGLGFQQKNYEYQRTGNYAGWYSRYTNNFLTAPLMIGAYLLNNPHETQGVWLKAAGGMYSEYWLSRKISGRYPVFNELQEDGSFNYTEVSDTYDFKANENQLNRWGYGIIGKAQIGYSFKKFDVYGSYTYLHGISDINKDNQDESRKESLRSHMFSVGASYKFN
ncbi:outer membrane beta-barrel protein [Chryseobacterium sp.]|uniref:outer membrane beta-barrel protein n=1 Tax=Chryseobacterium sp. TaxID=1871047 RepID=UPI0025C68D63|nr:outer membrane beta-barrel protein [Chryseobacterium sp.]MBV8325228.1 outer membrane beta-barrel protein [Chryseobacterium sp.]